MQPMTAEQHNARPAAMTPEEMNRLIDEHIAA